MVSPCLELLAQLPTSAMYIQPVKLVAIALVFTLWAIAAQWVDKDTVAVNTFRVLWNLIVLGSGTAALLIMLLVPVFWLGFPIGLVVDATALIVYVVHRNGLVGEADRVLTAGHFRRLREEGFSGKKKLKEVKEKARRTRMRGSRRSTPRRPPRCPVWSPSSRRRR